MIKTMSLITCACNVALSNTTQIAVCESYIVERHSNMFRSHSMYGKRLAAREYLNNLM